MKKIKILSAIFTAVLLSAAFANSASAKGGPNAECFECGEALYACSRAVFEDIKDEVEACVSECGGEPYCYQECSEGAYEGFNACKVSYEACAEAKCVLPNGKPKKKPF